MKTMDFDRIASSAPINRDAAVAFGGSGEHYQPKPGSLEPIWDVPPKLKAPPADAPQLVGLRKGNLTVLGMWADNPLSGHIGKWVVRCVCGNYTIRKSRALRNPENIDDMCSHCDHVRRLRETSSDKRIMQIRAERAAKRAARNPTDAA
jgi:hypothetical protein